MDISVKTFEERYRKFILEEATKQEVAFMNIDKIVYEDINLDDPRIVLMNCFWYQNIKEKN